MGNRQPALAHGVYTDWNCVLNRGLNTWHEHVRTKTTIPSGTDVTRVFSDGKLTISYKEATGEQKTELISVQADGKLDGVLLRNIVDDNKGKDKDKEMLLYYDEHYTVMIWGNADRSSITYWSTQKELSFDQLEYALKLTKAVGLTFNYASSLLNGLFCTNRPFVF